MGHVFRTETPHQWPGGARERGRMISRNTVRTVEVWADEWKELYYKAHPGMRDVDFGDVSPRIEIKERLQCKSMQWFLDNVFPFSSFTKDYKYIGEVGILC